MKTYHFKTLGVVEWKDIEVGEVFAEFFYDTIWIHLKRKKYGQHRVFVIANNADINFIGDSHVSEEHEIHKLPISVQRRWLDK